jgi:hypothetical protein
MVYSGSQRFPSVPKATEFLGWVESAQEASVPGVWALAPVGWDWGGTCREGAGPGQGEEKKGPAQDAYWWLSRFI